MRALPRAYPGQKIGLYGGSFDPAHEGHAHVARTAKKRLGLDRVWWLVSPQNPLKAQSSPQAQRLASARARAARGDVVTSLETALRARFTIETITALQARLPATRFVLILGEDNMASFAQWRRWAELIHKLPIAIVSRPGAGARARLAPAFARFAQRRINSLTAARLPLTSPPAWATLPAPYSDEASRIIRALAHP